MIRIFLSLLTLISLASSAQAEEPGSHGMLVFGEQTTYLSHLPMFHAPHDRQLLLAVSFRALPGERTLARYRDAKQQGAELFTLLPEPLILSALAAGQIPTFKADLYLGHFERGGTNLGPVEVEVTKVLVSHSLEAVPPASGAPESYVYFGANGEYFALHWVAAHPSFDMVMAMEPLFLEWTGRCPSRNCGSSWRTPVADSQLPLRFVDRFGKGAIPTNGSAIGSDLSYGSGVRKVLYLETQDLSD